MKHPISGNNSIIPRPELFCSPFFHKERSRIIPTLLICMCCNTKTAGIISNSHNEFSTDADDENGVFVKTFELHKK
jgi:hypothetical protein